MNGKFNEDWHLSASADTREGPVDELFSNFLNKSPDSLFRRIDPDYHYPTFGDDSVVEEVAPTLGKFYVKLARDESHAMWGNFKINYAENELAHVDRGLYGGNLHYQSEGTTSFGEQRFALDGFAAEPGTLASREEFRGTGGSLYFLRNQDILVGSERVRIELRDKDSGLVTGVVNLRPVLDYDIDYLQGRVVLAEPLNSTVDDRLLVRSGALSGDAAYLVVRYEYTPGFDRARFGRDRRPGARLGERLRQGRSHDERQRRGRHRQQPQRRRRHAAHERRFVVQGAGRPQRRPGFERAVLGRRRLRLRQPGHDRFRRPRAPTRTAPTSASASAISSKRCPAASRCTRRRSDAGYSAPGFGTMTDLEHSGGTFNMRMFERLDVRAKADKRAQDQGL